MELIIVKDSIIRYSMHNHTSSYLFGVLLSGDIILRKGDKECKLTEGSNFYVAPYEMHAIQPISEYTIATFVMPIDYFKSRSTDTIYETMRKLQERVKDFITISNHSLLSFKNGFKRQFIKMVY